MSGWVYRFKASVLLALLGERKYELWKKHREFRKLVVRAHYPHMPAPEVPAGHGGEKVLMAMFNGFEPHGGLADRFRGIVSAYRYALDRQFRFGILWTSPFDLKDYLVPSSYDWTISESEVCYGQPYACPIGMGSLYKLLNLDKEQEARAQWRMLDSEVKHHPHAVQYHLYSNAHFGDKDYHRLFHELFKPSPRLQRLLDEQSCHLNQGYLAMTFRFMQLLGDFRDERDGATLCEAERRLYVEACMETIRRVHAEHMGRTILVTSDSTCFLKEASALPYVYVVGGEVRHIGCKVDTRYAYDKEFIDLFLLSGASVIYRVHRGRMYYSGFPLAAGKMGNVKVVTMEI